MLFHVPTTTPDTECVLGSGPAKRARANATETLTNPGDRVEGLPEAQVLSVELPQHSDIGIHPIGIVDQQAMRSPYVDPCPSPVGAELMTTENSQGVLDAVALELLQIVNAAANEAKEQELAEEEADLYKKSEANEVVANFVDANGTDASDAAANIADTNEGGQE